MPVKKAKSRFIISELNLDNLYFVSGRISNTALFRWKNKRHNKHTFPPHFFFHLQLFLCPCFKLMFLP